VCLKFVIWHFISSLYKPCSFQLFPRNFILLFLLFKYTHTHTIKLQNNNNNNTTYGCYIYIIMRCGVYDDYCTAIHIIIICLFCSIFLCFYSLHQIVYYTYFLLKYRCIQSSLIWFSVN